MGQLCFKTSAASGRLWVMRSLGACALAAASMALGGPCAAAAKTWRPLHRWPFRSSTARRLPRGDQGDRYGRDPREGYGRDQREGYGGDRREPEGRGDRYGGGVASGGPGGSYQQSCRDVRMQASVLTAVCRDGRGGQVESSIDIGRCGRSDIGNQGGALACAGIRGNGRRVN